MLGAAVDSNTVRGGATTATTTRSASTSAASLVRRAYARTKCVVREHAEAGMREQRGGAQGRVVRRFCGRAVRKFGCVVFRVV